MGLIFVEIKKKSKIKNELKIINKASKINITSWKTFARVFLGKNQGISQMRFLLSNVVKDE